MNEPNVTLTRLIPATPQIVFEAWLDPKMLTQFMCPAPGTSVVTAETDPRVGGRFLVVMRIGDTDRPHQGVYLAIEPFTKIAFTWLSHAASEGSRVTLTFAPEGSQQTLLTLIHEGLEPRAKEAHFKGWSSIVLALASYVDAAVTPSG